ncbi:MAG: LTA synthase family protein [Bacteroidales bacterium]
MKSYKTPYGVLIIRLLSVFLFFTLSRVVFYAHNSLLFPFQNWEEGMRVFIGGIRFDMSSILWLNLPFILLCILPLPFRYMRWYRGITDGVFVFVNGLCIFLNLGDAAYYPFSLRRSTFELFTSQGMNKEVLTTILGGSVSYWYLSLLALVLLAAFLFLCYKTPFTKPLKRQYWKSALFFGLSVGLWIIGSRGGLQYKPLGVLDAGYYANSTNTTLVLNTPFVMMKTVKEQGLKIQTFYKEEDLARIYTPEYKPMSLPCFKGYLDKVCSLPREGNRTMGESSLHKPLNVVVIIVESLSAEYMKSFNSASDSYTPFLDSLVGKSFSFPCYANGTTSIESLPSILSSLPSLLGKPFVNSMYADNRVTSLPNYLKKHQYSNAFFHGGTNGTMKFDAYASKIGFDHYYGRNQYPNKNDYDGKWGIFDEPFLQFSLKVVDTMAKPFIACIYTLSSHHPYTMPKQYKNKFHQAPLPILPTIGYVDYSLRRFFEEAASKPWFKNTLFVITADHTAESYTSKFSGPVEKYKVPLLFYQAGVTDRAGISKLQDNFVAQVCDIQPSVLHYLGYASASCPVFAFGRSVFDTVSPRFAVNYVNGCFRFIDEHYIFIIKDGQGIGLYDYLLDKEMQNNLIHHPDYASACSLRFSFAKAFVQQYTNRLIKNQLYIEKKR